MKDKRFKITDHEVDLIFKMHDERLLARKRAKDITVDAICEKFGISHAYYYDLINGKNRGKRGVA